MLDAYVSQSPPIHSHRFLVLYLQFQPCFPVSQKSDAQYMRVPKPIHFHHFPLCASRACLILFPCVTKIGSPICNAFGFLKPTDTLLPFPSFVPPGHAQFYVHVSQKIGSQICSGLGILTHPTIHTHYFPVWYNRRTSHSFSCHTSENFHSELSPLNAVGISLKMSSVSTVLLRICEMNEQVCLMTKLQSETLIFHVFSICLLTTSAKK